MSQSQEPPHVFGITEADFQSWKHNPVTKMFRQYLADFAEALERGHNMRWRAGQLKDSVEYEAAGRVATLEEMAALEFSHIATFYQEPEQQEEHETEIVRNPTGEV